MKILKILLVIFILGVLLTAPILGCASESDMAEAETQVVTVQRGDLTVDITAVGNLELSHKEDLAFEIAGTVEEVLVEEGDTIEESQVLVKLDTSEWDKEQAQLKSELLQAEINLRNAEIALKTAQGTYTWPELEVAEADVEEAETNLQYAIDNGYEALIPRYRALLEAAEKTLNAMLTGANPDELEIKKLQFEIAHGKLCDAQEALDEAIDASPEIIAPFDGFVTNVNVSGGDEVKKGTVAVTIADPNRFEAELLVSEMDIFQVELGGEAWVQVDAMSGISLPAEVTQISPTATISQGVVNYAVKVEVSSLSEMVQGQQAARYETIQNIQQGELPDRLRQAVEEGQITQEQAEEMLKRIQEGRMSFPPDGDNGEVSLPSASERVTTISSENSQLREGLTVTVSIIVDERSNVLLVPNGAITTQGWQTYVRIVATDGSIEERAIQTGITDYQFTEVTDGLSEGDQVAVPQGTTTTTTTQQQGPRGGIMIPGMGGPPR